MTLFELLLLRSARWLVPGIGLAWTTTLAEPATAQGMVVAGLAMAEVGAATECPLRATKLRF